MQKQNTSFTVIMANIQNINSSKYGEIERKGLNSLLDDAKCAVMFEEFISFLKTEILQMTNRYGNIFKSSYLHSRLFKNLLGP